MNRHTVNINCRNPGNRDLMLDFIRKSTSQWVFLLDPDEFWIDESLRSGKRVVARIFDPFRDHVPGNSFDAKFHTLHSPFATYSYVKHFFSKYRNKEVYFVVGYNEPSNDDLPAQMKWFVEFGKHMINDGFKVCLGEWNTSKTLVEDGGYIPALMNGTWDELLHFASLRRKDVLLGFHDYAYAFVWGHQLDNFPNVLLNKQQMAIAKPRPLMWNSTNIRGQWHIGRMGPLIDYCVKKGLAPRLGISECWLDRMGDLPTPFLKTFEANFGMEQFKNEISGVRSLFRYYTWLSNRNDYSYNDFANDLMKQMDWVDEQYPKSFFEYFAWFSANGDYLWTAFNLSAPEMHPFLNKLKTYNKLPNGGSYTNMKQATVVNNTKFVRLIRSSPNVSATVIDRLGEDRETKIDADNLIISGDFAWLKMLTVDDKIGYVAVYSVKDPGSVYVVWTLRNETTPTPPPPSDPVPIGFINWEVVVEYDLLPELFNYFSNKANAPFLPNSLKLVYKALGDYVSALKTKTPEELKKTGGLLINPKKEE